MANVMLPFRGEFGWKVMAHAPFVCAHASPKLVCCEEGEEALYPGADSYIHVDWRDDYDRRQWVEWSYCDRVRRIVEAQYGSGHEFVYPIEHPETELSDTAKLKRFVPGPHVAFGVEAPNVVVCPRKRDYGPEKNWDEWPRVVGSLMGAGLKVFAAGQRETSYTVECEAAWDYERPLDATIEAINGCDFVLATDSGLAHLAILCGKPLVLVSFAEGLVAPGTRNGCGSPWRPIKLDRYEQCNHKGAPIRVVWWGWEEPDRVVETALSKANA